MKFSKQVFLLSFFFTFFLCGYSQEFQYVNFDKDSRDYYFKEYCEVLLDGETLMKSEKQGPMLFINNNQKGILSVSTIDRTNGQHKATKPVMFKIAIRDYHSNGIAMYSDQSYYEIDLEAVLNDCGFGSEIIIIPVEKKYQLPRHIISFDGC